MVAASASLTAEKSSRQHLQQGGEDLIDHRADVYSLGVILYQLLTGEVPFPSADNTFAIIYAARKEERPAITERRPDLPPAIDMWGQRALAIEREDRFQTAQELWQELGRICRG